MGSIKLTLFRIKKNFNYKNRNATTYMPTQPNPSGKPPARAVDQALLFHTPGICACAGDGGGSGYGGGFIFPPSHGGSIGDMMKVLT